MSNGPEFGWEYSHGGSQGNNFSQMGMNGSSPAGGGRQWLHSNQGNAANTGFMQSQGQVSYPSSEDPFASYNQVMMSQYTNYKPSFGHSQMESSMVNGISQNPGQGMSNGMGHGMSHGMGHGMGNGMGHGMDQNMGQAMGQSMGNGLGSMGGGQRLSGGNNRRTNGLNDPPQGNRSGWF